MPPGSEMPELVHLDKAVIAWVFIMSWSIHRYRSICTWKTFNLRVLKLESEIIMNLMQCLGGIVLFHDFGFTRGLPGCHHQLRFLTQSGVSVLPGDLTRLPLAAPIWGLAKALRAERPDLKVAVMDLEKLEVCWESCGKGGNMTCIASKMLRFWQKADQEIKYHIFFHNNQIKDVHILFSRKSFQFSSPIS